MRSPAMTAKKYNKRYDIHARKVQTVKNKPQEIVEASTKCEEGQWYANVLGYWQPTACKKQAIKLLQKYGKSKPKKESEAVGSYGRGACNQTWESSIVRKLTRK